MHLLYIFITNSFLNNIKNKGLYFLSTILFLKIVRNDAVILHLKEKLHIESKNEFS